MPATDIYKAAGENNGYYLYGSFPFSFSQWSANDNYAINPTITLPDECDYKNVRVVCVITIKTDDYSDAPSWNGDPEELQVRYIYTLYAEDDVAGDDVAGKEPSQINQFVHYQGEAYRYLTVEKGDFNGAKQRDYIKLDGNAPEENYTWDLSTNTYVKTTENIRQGVHTWEYDVYVIPGDAPRKLILPFQYYEGGGQDQDPQAYVRWYDWNTDKKVVDDGTFKFEGVGTFLTEHERGLFNIYQGYDQDLNHGNVGVTFEAGTDFTDSIDIACDVSKYSDGMLAYSKMVDGNNHPKYYGVPLAACQMMH